MKVGHLIMFGMVFFLFISLTYAGVLSYYGKVLGTVSVRGPTFYADLESNNNTIGKLLLNVQPNSTYTIQFQDGQSIIFWSDDFGGINFSYIPTCHFSIKIYSSQPSKVRLICKYYDTNDNEIQICEKSINTSTDFTVISESCTSSSILNLNSVKYIVYEVKGMASPSIIFYLETNPNGDTRLQVTG
ncbi:MAG: hypothetical protein QXI09_00205 [Candidatus Aenigmatarchaeota archaeon]